MRKALFLLFVDLSLMVACLQARRNVVFFFGDDAGFQMGAYNDTAIHTPNFDKLAARSVLFKHGYTSVSSCSPSRSVLLTGLPVHQNGMYALYNPPYSFKTFDQVRSLPQILSQHGIRTGIIGKKHVGPDNVFKFDYEHTDEIFNVYQVGRNITYMLQYFKEFLTQTGDRPFFLYLAFHDTHRCENVDRWGQFCERFGDGSPGNGVIPDWTPHTYSPSDVIVPAFLPDTPVTRQDLANMYKTYSRMDQGLGLFMKALQEAGVLEDTLVMYSADNGIPFPGAKTNLYEPGMGEPFLISNPQHTEHWGKITENMASLMDITPTILDWFNLTYPSYDLNNYEVKLTGRSLLPVTVDVAAPGYDWVFSSHNLHEVTMYYPMRVIRNRRYRLIHNLNSRMPYPMTGDVFQSPTFLDILNRTMRGEATNWNKPLDRYYYRDEWELYDLTSDPQELNNLAHEPSMQTVLQEMRAQLHDWREATADTWRCYPEGVLEGKTCFPLNNNLTSF